MILKSFITNKSEFEKFNFFLLYGDNEGHKEDLLKKIINPEVGIHRYDEKELLKDKNKFFESISSRSFFDSFKTVIISNSTDKILEIMIEIYEKKFEDLKIILIASILDKKSKLRNYVEKNIDMACIAFYPDNAQTLLTMTIAFFKDRKIPISNEILNKIVNRANGDRKYLKNELEKIENFCANQKKISLGVIDKLTNMSESSDISQLVDYCLAKNNKKVNFIINENNFMSEDSIKILRIFLAKAKRLLNLVKENSKLNNIDKTIISYKPPIFWKEREIVKEQLKRWSVLQVEKLIIDINNIELLIKKNSQNSITILFDFIFLNSKVNNLT